jgi:hypothetical protein
MELLLKSPFEKGGFRNLQSEGIYGNRFKREILRQAQNNKKIVF